MPTDERLISDPVLDDRGEAERIAQRLHRSVGNLEEADAQLVIAYGEQLLAMITASGDVDEPLLPELSSIRPAEAHVVLLTEIERAFTETLFRHNQLPDKVRVALLRLKGVELRTATPATTTLQFTKTEDFLNVEVVIPEGTEVASSDRRVRVQTSAALTIPAATAAATVQARAAEEGDIGIIKANSIGLLLEALAGISAVTNTTSLSGGTDAETADQGKIRAREEWRVGQHLGSIADFEEHIYFNVLRRKGRITGFEGYLSDFSKVSLGYTVLVVQGADGLAPTQQLLNDISAVVNQRHIAGLYVSVRPPIYKQFDIKANVKIAPGQSATTLINKAKANLVQLYDPLRFAYGPTQTERYLSISDVIGQIEAASPNGISAVTDSIIFKVGVTEYKADVPLLIGELPLLGNVTLNVVA